MAAANPGLIDPLQRSDWLPEALDGFGSFIGGEISKGANTHTHTS